jgi:hypothetical protein
MARGDINRSKGLFGEYFYRYNRGRGAPVGKNDLKTVRAENACALLSEFFG